MSFGKLEVKYPDGTTAVIELTKAQMIMGRSSDVDAPINDPQISRRHALLLCEAAGVKIVDAGSANGTYLAGTRLPAKQPVPLADGAELRMGQTFIKFVAPKAGEAAAEQPAPPASAPKASDVHDQGTVVKPLPPKKPKASDGETRPPPTFGPPPEKPAAPPEPAPQTSGPPPGVPAGLSSYLQYLPALYSTDDFMGRFLLIFESILKPVERTVDNLPYYFDAQMAPPDFLPWLASWLGLVLDERWPEAQRRALIRSAVDLYQWRGTRRGLAEFVRLYTGYTPEITEPGVGKGKTAEGDAFRFNVKIKVPDPAKVDRAVIQSILDAEKPAHAGYTVEITGA